MEIYIEIVNSMNFVRCKILNFYNVFKIYFSVDFRYFNQFLLSFSVAIRLMEELF